MVHSPWPTRYMWNNEMRSILKQRNKGYGTTYGIFFYLKEITKWSFSNFFFNIPYFYTWLFGYINLTKLKKNSTWCPGGRSSEQSETFNVPINLIDFCHTCQPGIISPFEVHTFKVLITGQGKIKMQNNWLTCWVVATLRHALQYRQYGQS